MALKASIEHGPSAWTYMLANWWIHSLLSVYWSSMGCVTCWNELIIIIITIICRDEAGVQDTFLTYEVYKDDITMQLVAAASKLLGRQMYHYLMNNQRHHINVALDQIAHQRSAPELIYILSGFIKAYNSMPITVTSRLWIIIQVMDWEIATKS